MKKHIRRLLHPWILLLICFIGVHADWVTDSVATGANPYAVAVNPITNKTYVANNAGGTVTIINNVTDSTTTVTVGTSPTFLGINPVTNKIYVANSGSNSVTVIDGATNATTSINVGTSPGAIGINTIKNLIVVANSGSNTLSIINGSNNAVRTVTVGTNPCAIAIDPAWNRAYIANKGSNTISVLDSTNTVLRTITVGNSPCAVAVNVSTDAIYVANQASGTVTLIDGISYSTQTISVGSYPGAIAVNPATNSIYVANYIGNTVTTFKEAGIGKATILTGTSPNSLAINVRTNKIYVTNAGSNSISVINGDSNTVTSVGVGVSPHAVAINPITSKIYVANLGSNSISVINGASFVFSFKFPNDGYTLYLQKVLVNPLTNKIYLFATGRYLVINGTTDVIKNVTASSMVATAAAINYMTNKLYVLNNTSGHSTVNIIDSTDAIVSTITVGANPQDIAVNPYTNMIYVANRGPVGIVTAINGDSYETTTIPAGNYPRSLAINSVTNKVYVADDSAGTVTVINGLTNQFEKTIKVFDNSFFPNLNKVVVNSLTNTIYALGASENKIAIINGTNDAVTILSTGNSPEGLLLNPSTNMVYTTNFGDNTIMVLNGTTGKATTLTIGNGPWYPELNPLTNEVYVVCSGDGTFCTIEPIKLHINKIAMNYYPTVMGINPVTSKVYAGVTAGTANSFYLINLLKVSDTKVSAVLDTIGKSIVPTSHPIFTGYAVNHSISKPGNIIDKVMQGNGFIAQNWSQGSINGSGSTDSVSWSWNWGSDSLVLGLNYISCVAFESNTGTTNNCGIGTPFTGNVTIYPILCNKVLSAIVPGAPTLLSPPNGDTALPLSNLLTWSSVANTATYHIQVATVSTFATSIINDSIVNTTTKSVSGLQSGMTYYWRVNASNYSGTSMWSTVWHFTTGSSVPTVPILLTPSNGAITVAINPRLTWDTVNKAISYTVQVAFDSAFTQLTINDSTLTISAKNVPSLPIYTKCFWRVLAKGATGSSPWSPAWSFTTSSQTPVIHGIGKAKALIYSCIKQGNSIIYSLPQESRVSLCYYDMQGRLSATIINKVVSAGEYSLPIDHSFPSRGAYIQVFKAGSFIKQECVTLLK